eukprot:1149378-Pelagomonas_calceolata.AAC.1
MQELQADMAQRIRAHEATGVYPKTAIMLKPKVVSKSVYEVQADMAQRIRAHKTTVVYPKTAKRVETNG